MSASLPQIHSKEVTDIVGESDDDCLHVIEHEGRCYVFDSSLVFSTDSDLIVAVATEASCLVVGGGAETVSGTFWFTAADANGLRRLDFDIASQLTAPFDLGDPLPSESSTAWRDGERPSIRRLTDCVGSPRTAAMTVR